MHPDASECVRMRPNEWKHHQTCTKTSKNFQKRTKSLKLIDKCSKCYPDASEWIRMGPNGSEHLRKPSNDPQNIQKHSKKHFVFWKKNKKILYLLRDEVNENKNKVHLIVFWVITRCWWCVCSQCLHLSLRLRENIRMWYRLWPKKRRKEIWQRPSCFYAQPTAPRQTLNDRLPFENGSHRPQTLGKRVSDDSPHFIFRLPKIFPSGFFQDFLKVFSGFSYYFEELRIFGRFWHLLHEKPHHVDLLSTL